MSAKQWNRESKPFCSLDYLLPPLFFLYSLYFSRNSFIWLFMKWSALWKGVTISFMASSSFLYWSRGIFRHSLSPLSQVSLKRMESRANSSLVVKPICLFFFDEILSLSQQFRQKRYCLVQERVYVVLVSLHFRKKGGVADNIFQLGQGFKSMPCLFCQGV